MQVGAARVEVVRACACEQHGSDQVDEQADRREQGRLAGQHRGRMHQPLDRLPDDEGAEGQHADAVEEGAQDLGAEEAVVRARADRPRGQPQRDVADHERDGVRGHVDGVGEQHQAAGPDAADDLDGAGDRRQHDAQQEPLALPRSVDVQARAAVLRAVGAGAVLVAVLVRALVERRVLRVAVGGAGAHAALSS